MDLAEAVYDSTLPEIKDTAKIKIILSPGTAGASIEELSESEPNLVMYCRELKLPPEEIRRRGLSLKTTGVQRPYPEVKTTSCIVSKYEHRKAIREGYDDALFIKKSIMFPGDKAPVLEGPSFNIMYIVGNEIRTPSTAVLPGVTREKVIKLANEIGLLANRGIYTLEEFLKADEALASGTPKGVLPITQVDQRNIADGKPGQKTQQIMQMFRERYF